MFELVYGELRAMAAAMMGGQRAGHTLQPTALVNEAFVKLLSRTALRADNRLEFLSLAARVMRQVLVDHARERGALKRGGGAARVTFEDAGGAGGDALDVLALHEALGELAGLDERRARLVEMRVFAGMSLEEAAEALGVARSTAASDWRLARAFLLSRMEGRGDGAGKVTR